MYFKNSVIFINDDLADLHKHNRDDITRFFEHDERVEMSLKEELIGSNTKENIEDLLDNKNLKR